MRLQQIGAGMFLVYDKTGGFLGAIAGTRGKWTAFPSDGTEVGWHTPIQTAFSTRAEAAEALQ